MICYQPLQKNLGWLREPSAMKNNKTNKQTIKINKIRQKTKSLKIKQKTKVSLKQTQAVFIFGFVSKPNFKILSTSQIIFGYRFVNYRLVR